MTSRANSGGNPSTTVRTRSTVASGNVESSHEVSVKAAQPLKLPFEDTPDDPSDFELLKSMEGEKASGLRPMLIRDMIRTTGVLREQWRQAAIAEIEGLRSMTVFREARPDEVTAAMKNKSLLPMKLVAGEKPAEHEGGPRKKKVRLVVCGNFDTRALQYSISTTQADAESLRMVLRLAAYNQWDLAKGDVKQAFLRAPLHEKGVIVVTTPKALEDLSVMPRQCWVLQRALYGLREAPKAWQDTRDKVLTAMTFGVQKQQYRLTRSGLDSDLWLIVQKGESSTPPQGFVVVYVDDVLVLGKRAVVTSLMSVLSSTWELGTKQHVHSGSGESLSFLGLNIVLEKSGSIWIDQKQFGLDLLEKWKMKDANPTKTPGVTDDWKGPPEAELGVVHEGDKQLLQGTQQMVGSLLWLAGRTRPDLSYPVSRLASFLGKDLARAFGGCKKALRYLRGTLDCGLRYTPKPKVESSLPPGGLPQLEAFGDASFGAEDLQAQQGVVVFWGGDPVMWRSCRQTLSSSSTAEAELQAVHLTSLLLENAVAVASELLGEPTRGEAFAPLLRSDNTAAICLATEPPQHWRTRHLALRAKVVQERIKTGGLRLTHVSTGEQRADSLTKPFHRSSNAKVTRASRCAFLGRETDDGCGGQDDCCCLVGIPQSLPPPPCLLVPSTASTPSSASTRMGTRSPGTAT